MRRSDGRSRVAHQSRGAHRQPLPRKRHVPRVRVSVAGLDPERPFREPVIGRSARHGDLLQGDPSRPRRRPIFHARRTEEEPRAIILHGTGRRSARGVLHVRRPDSLVFPVSPQTRKSCTRSGGVGASRRVFSVRRGGTLVVPVSFSARLVICCGRWWRNNRRFPAAFI